MMYRYDFLRWPVEFYDHIYTHYGFIGVFCGGLVVVLSIVGVFIWLDRRK